MTAYINQISSLSPKVWYRLNETSGTPTNYGSLSTSSTFSNLTLDQPTNVDGRSAYFNGSTSSIKLPNWSAFSLFDDRSFTTEMWFKIDYDDTLTLSNPAVDGDKFRPLFTYISQNGEQSIGADIGTTYTQASGIGGRGKLIVTNYIGTFNQYISTETYADNAWHHLVVVNNTTSFKVYVDGVLKRNAGVSSSPTTIDMDDNSFYVNAGKLIGARVYDQGGDSIQPLSRFKGFIDEVAIYDRELTSTEVTDNFTAGASATIQEGPATASSLFVHPSLITQAILTADPATASATADGHYQTDLDLPLLLNQYMQTLNTAGYLEQWYKFDAYKNVINYGNGGSSGFQFTGNADNLLESGVQLNGALAVTGSLNDGHVFASVGDLAAGNTEFSDSNYVAGIWIKTPSSITSGRRDLWSATDGNSRGPSVSTGAGTNQNSIRFTVSTSNGEHQLLGTTNVMDGNWHFVVCKQNDHAMELFIDGSSQGTLTANGSLMGTVTQVGFGSNNVTAFGGDKLLLSNFFVGNTTNITTGVITNIYNAGKDQLQGTAFMLQPAFKNNSAFNDYIESKSPLIDYRFNESTGTPSNFGSVSLTPAFTNTSYVLGRDAIDSKAIEFTNRDTTFKATYALASGTVSTDDKVTMGVLFKTNNISAAHPLIGFGGFVVNSQPAAGVGNHLLVNTTGTLAVRSGNADGTFVTNTGTTNYGDSNWHLAIVVQDTSTLNLYVDGKLEFTASRSTPFTDSGQFAVAGFPGPASGANANLVKFIDSAFVTAGAFTANEAFDAWQALRLVMDTTATALFPMPAVQAGFGPTVTADVSTATAFLPNVFPFIAPATASGLFQMPNFLAQKVVSVTADPMTASAQGENPGWDIGENNQVLHMDAAATFPQPILLIPGFWFANPGIALNAMLPMPALSTTLGALVKPQSFNANAFAPLPPAYFTILDDLWYQRLVAIDEKDDIDGRSLVFFNTSDNFYVGSEPVPGSGWTAPLAVGKTAVNAVTNPLPAINGGYFDAQNRKAVNLRNIALTTGQSGSGGTGATDFTFEAMIKTTKSNQVLFAGTNTNIYNTQRTAIILRDGKLALTNPKDRREGSVSANDQYLAFTGFKNIADGQWHHIIIQNKKGRNQFWIDGQLDIQRYGNDMYLINTVGYNSPELNSYSDFTISAFGLNLSALVEQSEINLNYLAAINVVPVKATVATASVTFGTGTRGKGNRARALMLYFWPTFNAESGYYVGQYNNPFAPVGVNDTEGKDVGNESYDYDTFYGLTTYLNDTPQQFFDWDVFPLPVQRFYAGDKYRGDRNPLLNDTVRIGGGPFGDTYKDDVTDNYRYLDLIKDVYELDQYDAIFFRNYPDQSTEQDKQGLNSKTEVDEYFNLQERTLFNEFLESLRKAIDEYGISLFVTNPQLAVDLGIIEAATPVPLLRDTGKFNADEWSDNRAPVLTGRIDPNTGEPYDPEGGSAGWYDTFFNDKHRVINTLEYLTDDNAFIWTDYAYYQNSDEFNYGGPNRLYKRYENRPNGLQIGDEFVFADSGNPKYRAGYQAIKPEHLKAGIPITALTTTIHEQNFDSYAQGPNPYKDYITTVALPVGTNLKGKLTGGKIFVSFSENVANSFTLANRTQFNTDYEEYHQYDLATNYWVDIAFNAGIIDANTRALYKNSSISDAERGQPELKLDGDIIAQRWSLNGDYVVSQLIPITKNLKGFVGGEVGPEIPPQNRKRTRAGLGGITPGTRLRDALGRFASGTSGGGATATTGGLVTYKVTTGRIYDTGVVFIPSINTRGLWWLSDKNIIEGKVVGGVGMSASATIPNPIVTADHPAAVTATHMLAQATFVDNTSGSKNNIALPLIASGFMPTLGGRRIAAEPAVATAFIVSINPLTETDYTVTLYLNHTDPILYIRKEVIK